MVGRRPAAAAGGGGGLILGDRQAQGACWDFLVSRNSRDFAVTFNFRFNASVAFVPYDLSAKGWEKCTNTFFHTGVVWSAVVDDFPQHEGCVLVGTFTSTAVVQYRCVLILVAVIIDRVAFAQTRFNLYKSAHVFVAVNAVIRPVHFRSFCAFCFLLRLSVIIAFHGGGNRTLRLGKSVDCWCTLPLLSFVSCCLFFFFSAFETNSGEVTCCFR
jgi:hypothetical protein